MSPRNQPFDVLLARVCPDMTMAWEKKGHLKSKYGLEQRHIKDVYEELSIRKRKAKRLRMAELPLILVGIFVILLNSFGVIFFPGEAWARVSILSLAGLFSLLLILMRLSSKEEVWINRLRAPLDCFGEDVLGLAEWLNLPDDSKITKLVVEERLFSISIDILRREEKLPKIRADLSIDVSKVVYLAGSLSSSREKFDQSWLRIQTGFPGLILYTKKDWFNLSKAYA